MSRKIAILSILVLMLLASFPHRTSAADSVEVKFMAWGSPEELAVWQKIADEFHADHPTITVTLDVSDWNSYWDKVKTLYAGGTPPDIFAMDGPLYPDWAGRGVLLNLQPYLDKEPKLLDGLYPNTLEAYKLPDGYYGLPRDFQTIVLFYNKEMFDKAGVAYPTDKWTLDDLRQAAKKLTLKGSDGKITQWGFSSELVDMEGVWSSVLWAYGGEIINKDHTKTLLAQGKARDAWHFLNDMMFVDQSMPDPNTLAQFGGDGFAAGVAAMTTSGHWVVPQYSQLKFHWDVAAYPSGPAGRATSVNSAGFVISKDTKSPDAAWEFVKYAIGTKGQTRLAELGFSIPILKSIANSPIYLNQKTAPINHQIFLDALSYARVKPSFKGYDEWASTVGDILTSVWTGDEPMDKALDEIVPKADAVLANNQ